jgi:Cd2+/Zn2+-exporting ATPase
LIKDMLSNAKLAWLMASALGLLALEAVSYRYALPLWACLGLLALALALGWEVLWGGAKALAQRRFSEIKLLITVAAVGAVLLKQYPEAAVVLVLFALSEALEDYGFRKSYASLEGLLQRTPQEATLKGGAVVPVSGLVPGQRLELRPGQVVPVDGHIIAGYGLLDEAAVTGEPMPISRGPGERVFAGTLNLDGFLEIEAVRAGLDSTLSRIVAMTYEAAERKLQLQSFIERFSRVYTPAIMLIALGLALWPLFTGGPFQPWVERALSLLVIACPCALTMATPVSVFAAISNASQRGIVVKGGRAMASLAGLRAMAFDKTRTLTYGEPRVTELWPFREGWSPSDILAAAAGLESLSRHPLAEGVLRHAREEGVAAHPMKDFKDLSGRGVAGSCSICRDGHHCLGSPDFADAEHGLDAEALAKVEALQAQGKTVMVLSDSEGALGLLALEDRLREDSRATVQAIQALGVHTLMLTGDHARAAEAVAESVGIGELRAGLLPQDKAEAIRDCLAHRGPTAMVGDGVNDAPALALATVGIAMGAAGSDIAVENADVALMNDSLAALPFLIRLSRGCVGTIRWNIALALGAKLLVLLLVLEGRAGLAAAILSDVGVTVLVIFNGLRLLSFE